MTLLEELNKSSLFLTSLYATRSIFEREIGIKGILIATDEMIKQRIMQRAGQSESPQYPYAYLSLSEVQAVKDMQAGKNVRRHGYRMQNLDVSRATSTKGFIFPVTAAVDLKYTDSDPVNVIKVAEAMMIISQIGYFNFSLTVGRDPQTNEGGLTLEPRIEIPDSISIPLADTNTPNSPNAMEVTLSFILHTYSGFFRDVSAVNSARPTIVAHIDQGDGYAS